MFLITREFSVNQKEFGNFANSRKLDLLFRNFVDEIGNQAVSNLQNTVPLGPTHRLFNAINKSDVKKRGPLYSINVGILPIVGADDEEYPRYVEEGTGNFYRGSRSSLGTFAEGGNLARFGGDEITPLHGNFLQFIISKGPNKGKHIRTKSVKGQEGQFFMTKAARETNEWVRTHKKILAQEIKAIT